MNITLGIKLLTHFLSEEIIKLTIDSNVFISIFLILTRLVLLLYFIIIIRNI